MNARMQTMDAITRETIQKVIVVGLCVLLMFSAAYTYAQEPEQLVDESEIEQINETEGDESSEGGDNEEESQTEEETEEGATEEDEQEYESSNEEALSDEDNTTPVVTSTRGGGGGYTPRDRSATPTPQVAGATDEQVTTTGVTPASTVQASQVAQMPFGGVAAGAGGAGFMWPIVSVLSLAAALVGLRFTRRRHVAE